MGMYTEFFFRADLLDDTPEEVVNLLHAMTNGAEYDGELPDHKLFTTQRWEYMLNCSSAYFPQPTQSLVSVDKILGISVAIHTNFKNYGNEIELFCDWIDPYVNGFKDDFLGYSLYEEDDEPDLIRKKVSKPLKPWAGIRL